MVNALPGTLKHSSVVGDDRFYPPQLVIAEAPINSQRNGRQPELGFAAG